MSDQRRPKGVRLPRITRRLPQLPAAPPPERQILIQTTTPTPTAPPTVPPTFRAASEWVWRSLIIGVGILALLWLISKLSEVVFPVLIALLLIWRPLRFDSLDPQSAAARGVPTVAVSLGFMLLLGLVVAVAVHIIGALLVMALVVTPAAAATRVTSGPVAVPVLSAVFGIVAAVGGILLAVMGTLPVSPYITTISFAIYLVCRLIGNRRGAVTRAR